MSRIEIITATPSHIQAMGNVINVEDVEEANALGIKSHKALWRSWQNSIIRKAALVDGEIMALWGCAGSFMGTIGQPWLVTGRKAREINPHEFAMIYRAEARKMFEMYPVLENHVDNRYYGAIRMLKIAGFNVDEPAPYGTLNMVFRRFWKVS